MELTLVLPGQEGPKNPRHAREILAYESGRAPDGESVDARVFHYGENGKPLPGMAPIRFSGKGRDPQLLAIGNYAVSILNHEASKIVSAFERHYGEGIIEQRVTRPFSISCLPRLQSYWTPSMVIQENPADHKRFQADLKKGIITKDLIDYVTRKIKNSLRRQAHYLDLDIEDDGEMTLGDVSIKGGVFPIQVKPGVFYLAAKRVVFRCSLGLEGPWNVGHLAASGYGRIYPCRPGGSPCA